MTPILENEHAPSFILKYKQILKNFIIKFNLYKNPNKRSIEQIQYQRISTRIFVILLTVSLIVLLVYVSLENVTQTITVKNPPIERFNILYQQYSDNLRCPCKTSSIKYQTFIQFDPQFHSICASDFVISQTWLEIQYPEDTSDVNAPIYRTNVDDFRHMASPLFQLLSSFCQLSLQTLNTEILTFNFTTFITPNMISQQQFDAQTSQIINQFISNTARSFLNAFRFVNNMTSANMLISALSSDSVLTEYPQYYDNYYDKYNGYDYNADFVYDRRDQQYNSSLTGVNCNCQENPFCIQQAIVYDFDATTTLFHVPGNLYIKNV